MEPAPTTRTVAAVEARRCAPRRGRARRRPARPRPGRCRSRCAPLADGAFFFFFFFLCSVSTSTSMLSSKRVAGRLRSRCRVARGYFLHADGRLVQQLVDDAVHCAGDLGRARVSRSGSCVDSAAARPPPPRRSGCAAPTRWAPPRRSGAWRASVRSRPSTMACAAAMSSAATGSAFGRPGLAARSPCSNARSTTCTPGSAATPGSTSRGRARSTTTSGRSSRRDMAAATMSVCTTRPWRRCR